MKIVGNISLGPLGSKRRIMFEWDDKPCKGLILRQAIPVTTFSTGGDH